MNHPIKKKRIVFFVSDEVWERKPNLMKSILDSESLEKKFSYNDFSDLDPLLKEAVRYSLSKKIDQFVVSSIDDLGDSANSVEAILEFILVLNSQGIHFLSLEDHISSENCASDFIARLINAVDLAKPRIKGKKVRAALAHSKELGESVGRPRERNDLEIKRLKQEGLSHQQIANELGISTRSVSRSLNEARP